MRNVDAIFRGVLKFLNLQIAMRQLFLILLFQLLKLLLKGLSLARFFLEFKQKVALHLC
jgi:hypothetical protein